MSEWRRKVIGWLRRDTQQAELEEEMRTHLEMKAAAGQAPDAAYRQFGNSTLVLEDARAAWGWPRPEAWLRDIRYGLRMMARRPGFAATVVLTLALGISASSTIMTLIDGVLIRPLPYPDSGRLMAVYDLTLSSQMRKPISPGRLEDLQRLNTSFEAIAGSYEDSLTDSSGTVPQRVPGAFVSPHFFSVMGAPAEVGRTFNSAEEQFGGPLAIVISDGFWRRRFAADPGVLGRSLVLEGQSYSIIGVMPASFQYPVPGMDVWASKQARPVLMQIREARFYNCVGRLKPHVTPEQALADLNTVQRRLGEQYPKTDAGWGVAMEPLKDRVVGRVRLALWLLLGSATLLLLISCANVACLLLGQLNTRAAEMATRRALGAGTAVIARQLFAEGAAYAMAGAVLGIGGVYVGVPLLRLLPQVPRVTEIAVDGRSLAIIVAVSILAAMLFSLAPVLQTFRRDLPISRLRGGRGVAGRGQRLPRLLVFAQLAMATVLLIGSGLFLRSLLRLQETPLGFRIDKILTFRISASFAEAPEATVQRHQRTMDALAALPGVQSVAMAAGVPAVNATWPTEFQIAGEADPSGVRRFVTTRVVTSGYFQTLGIPIVAGETCRMNPDPAQPFEAVINRKLAGQHFGGRNPVGRTLSEGQLHRMMRIRGVVENVREDGFAREPDALIYMCGYLRYWPGFADFLLRTQGGPGQFVNTVRHALQEVEPGRAIYSVRTLPEALDGTLSQYRFRALLVSLFSALALALAAIGLYGVMAFMVTERTREIGVRVALGARPSQIVFEILRSGGALTVAAAGAGAALAAIASRLVATLLYGVPPFDGITYLTAGAVLLGVALLACLIPGRRATSIDPVKALREQ